VTPFGIRTDGRVVHAVTLSNTMLRATVLTHGAVLQSLYLSGQAHSLTLGATDIAAYEGDMTYFGSVIAPVVNRIKDASAQIAGRAHRFQANEGPNTLHSGAAGTQNALWSVQDHGETHVTLTVTLPDGEGGFPGNRRITATYALSGDTLSLDITATTDAPTLMNIAHHGYWNLDGTETWAGHTLTVHADRILPNDNRNLPTGVVQSLDGHPHDMRHPRRITPGDLPPLDHNFCLADARRELTPALCLTGATGLTMEIATTEPGLQIFDAAPINTGALSTLHNRTYRAHCGLAIEPQSWPDAPHHPHFPNIVLHPGEPWHQTTTFCFAPASSL